MRSDFINKRLDVQRKRNALSNTNFIESEIIVEPEFDLFFLHEVGLGQSPPRWTNTSVGNDPLNSPEIPVGLLNPWDDGEDKPVSQPPFFINLPSRSPTRTAMAFNLQNLPENAQIQTAFLNLTVSNKRDWD